MNHRWKDNKCIRCGIVRERKEYKKLLRTYSKLCSDGCFHDIPIWGYGIGWWYGDSHEFNRPHCIKTLKTEQ